MISLLLLMQVWVGFARGQEVCIPIGTCERHQECEHGHDHGLIPPVGHDHDDCGCHMHLPSRDDPQTPSPRGVTVDVTMKFVAVVCMVEWPTCPPAVMAAWSPPPDRSCSAHFLGLKTTRLLI
jgi:hypothetical protein